MTEGEGTLSSVLSDSMYWFRRGGWDASSPWTPYVILHTILERRSKSIIQNAAGSTTRNEALIMEFDENPNKLGKALPQ